MGDWTCKFIHLCITESTSGRELALYLLLTVDFHWRPNEIKDQKANQCTLKKSSNFVNMF